MEHRRRFHRARGGGGSAKDQFVNFAFASVVESAANTLTFTEIQTGVSIFEKSAWVVHRIDWIVDGAVLGLLSADDDELQMALTVSNQITSIALNQSAVVAEKRIGAQVQGTPAVLQLHDFNLMTSDYSTLPGNGIIVPPRPLFVAVQGQSLATVATIAARVYFTHRELKTDEYWELVESRRMVQ